jgi:hypothetical protein
MRKLCLSLISLVFLLSLVQSAAAQGADISGVWGGALATDAGPGGLEVTLSREGAQLRATLKMRLEGQEAAPQIEELKFNGDQISFAAILDNNLLKFSGKFSGDKLEGAVEAFRADQKIGSGTFSLTRGGVMPPLQRQQGGQIADETFDAKVDHPAYKKNGPKVLFDEAHHNFHTAAGRYKPFADLIGNDGYLITSNKQPFSAAVLKGYRVLVISNALGAARMGEPAAGNPAFTALESDAVRDWVKGGGALLLIADHAPMGSANQILGERFGVDMSKMYTVDEQNCDKESGSPSFIVYTRESGRLADHPITRGRDNSERVNRIIAFTGQSLKGPADSVPFMKLADSAQDTMPGPAAKPVSAAGRAQGIAMKLGKGRVVFLGEAGMLTAQVAGPQRVRFGMNRAGIDNRQLALNLMHWLSGLLKER